MNHAVRLSLWWSLCALPCAAQAQIILCKDGAGRTFVSDRAIPECADRAQRVMDRSGVVRQQIPAPLTSEQKKAQRAEEERLRIQVAAE